MSLFVRLVLALFLCVTSGCADYSVYISKRGATRPPVPRGTPFQVINAPPPPGAVYLGKVTFYGRAYYAAPMLELLRERIRLAGGNLVARLRCQGLSTFAIRTQDGVAVGGPVLARTRVHCVGSVYRVNR